MSRALSFEPLKLRFNTYNLVIPILENGAADLTDAEVSCVITRAGKEMFPNPVDFEGRNLLRNSNNDFGPFFDSSGPNYESPVIQNGIAYYKAIGYNDTSVRFMRKTNLNLGEDSFSLSLFSKPNATGTITRIITLNYPHIGIPNSPEFYLFTWSGIRTFNSILLYQSRTSTTSQEEPSEIWIDWIALVKGDKPLTHWTPAPEDLLNYAEITCHNCFAVAIDDKIKITTITPGATSGWVDVKVEYGNLSSKRRLNWSLDGSETYEVSHNLLKINGGGDN